MPVTKTIRSAAKTILGPKATALVRRVWAPWPPISAYATRLQLKRGLEIGGPSSMFADDGPVPVYRVLGSVDNCLFSTSTIWTGDVQEGHPFHFHPNKPPGAQIISEAADLRIIPDAVYGCVLACHCLEHVANPLRALSEWKRVLVADGVMLLILPHRDGTFDWRRPATPLPHMIADYERQTAEDDLTHLPEILELHDHSMDPGGLTKEQFRERSLHNCVNRALHHHVFDTMTASQLVDFSGFQILRIDMMKPCHIIILASRTNGSVDNRQFLLAGRKQWRRSPFPSDRVYARQ